MCKIYISSKMRSRIMKVSVDVNGDIVYANDAFLNIYGYNRDDILGKNIRIIKYNCIPREYFDTMWKDIMSKRPWHGILPSSTKSGNILWTIGVVYPVYDYSGDIVEYSSERIIARKSEIVIGKKEIKEKYGWDCQ